MHDGRWRASTDLVWTRYDDCTDWTVFNPRSGDVHLLTESARFLWQRIAETDRLTTVQLLDALAAQIAIPLDSELIGVAGQTLEFMDRAGLITPDVR
jgi:PqqD family protein of HPr-rel-A system